MRLSIRIRTILALNVFVLGISAVLGWIAQGVAGQIVEERFAKEMATGVSRFLQDRRLPLSNQMMTYLGEMFRAEWLACEGEANNVVGASLSAPLMRDFRAEAARVGDSGVMRLGGEQYRVESADVTIRDPRTGRPTSSRLFMLVPYAQFQEARGRAAAKITRVMLPAAAVATIFAVLFAFTITRPIRRLAGEMDRLAAEEEEGATDGQGTLPAVCSVPVRASAGEETVAPGGPVRRGRPPHGVTTNTKTPYGVTTNVTTNAARAPASRGPLEIARLATSFRRLLDRLAAARQRAARSERLATLGKVCLSVAHELRNPLSGIKMNVRVLKDRLPASPDDSGIDVILGEIERMDLYLNELMTLSTGAQPGEPPPGVAPPQPVRLSELAGSVLAILTGRCRHAKVRVATEYPPDEPLVRADANPLRQAMMNLIVNAIEAMPSGGNLRIRVLAAPGAAAFRVADTGPGVRAEPGRDVFDAFVSNKPNGVGLGLYLARQIITRHGGRIGYDDSPSGAEFWFELPIADSPAAETP